MEQISIFNLKIIEQIPKEPIQFKSKIGIQIVTDDKVNSSILKNLKLIKNSSIIVHEKPGRESKKTVYNLSYKKLSSNSFRLDLTVDGGLPIKRFVEGNSVSPNVSQILDLQCKCKEFDFYDIEI